MIKLSVNVNKVALLRNSRSNGIPDVSRIAEIALQSGAHGITVHPRPDERHIRADDVVVLRGLVSSYRGTEFNIEGNPFHGLLEHVQKTLPEQCTLVPDDVNASTSDHGWALGQDASRLEPVIRQLRDLGVRVSLFMDPDPRFMTIARDIGADRVELYTEPYAIAHAGADAAPVIRAYSDAAHAAREAGLGVNAGHDLNLDNLPRLVEAIPFISEVSIGHALIGDALVMGMANATRAYLNVLAAR